MRNVRLACAVRLALSVAACAGPGQQSPLAPDTAAPFSGSSLVVATSAATSEVGKNCHRTRSSPTSIHALANWSRSPSISFDTSPRFTEDAKGGFTSKGAAFSR